MTLAGSVRAAVYAQGLRERADLYARPVDDAARAALQLEALNREWRRVVEDVRHYGDELRAGSLPERFASLEEFVERVPATTREDVQRDRARRTSRSRRADFQRVTGGSTAQPVQLPAWDSELEFTRYDVWAARSWFGLTPASRLFLLWGHSHLLGTGVAGWLRARKREVLDRVTGCRRFSAYDLRRDAMQRAGEALLRFRPDYVVGYGVALDAFAQANAARAGALRALGVRLVLGAAEAFPAPESARHLEELFGCPVGMEYGSVETGLLAHTDPAGSYRVFWRSYLLDGERQEQGRYRLRVTSLYPRCFPLLRYDIGDEVDPGGSDRARFVGGERLARVAGRCNEFVELEDGARVHSEAFTHAVRPESAVQGYQVVQARDGLRIDVLSDAELPQATEAAIRERLRRVHPSLGTTAVRRVERLRQTVAGKTRMIVKE